MSQFMIPSPSTMAMTGDLPSNWEFFRDSWKSYVTATCSIMTVTFMSRHVRKPCALESPPSR